MTRIELFKCIWGLHNYLYRIWNEECEEYEYVILGYCESSTPDDIEITQRYKNMLDKMIEIYKQGEMSEDDKSVSASYAYSISRRFDHRFPEMKSKEELEKFILGLSEKQYLELSEQVSMYLHARELCLRGYR